MTLKVTATLCSPLGGDAPQLDGLLVACLARVKGKAHNTYRSGPCPPVGDVPIPVPFGSVGGERVYRVSGPILCGIAADKHDHYTRRFPSKHAALLSAQQRGSVAMTNGEYKSYMLPLRVRAVGSVVWFCEADRRELLRLLKRSVLAIGKKTSMGYGRIAEWSAETVDGNWTWFSPSDHGPVLMRPLPLCDDLPRGLLGARRDFGACQPPYWHPDRNMELVVPC